MSTNNDRIEHMLTAINKIEAMTDVPKEVFLNSIEKRDAVVFNFAILGEAARQLSDDLRKQFPDVPWRIIIGMRNVLIHDYVQTNYDLVWTSVKNDLPVLKKHLETIKKTL